MKDVNVLPHFGVLIMMRVLGLQRAVEFNGCILGKHISSKTKTNPTTPIHHDHAFKPKPKPKPKTKIAKDSQHSVIL